MIVATHLMFWIKNIFRANCTVESERTKWVGRGGPNKDFAQQICMKRDPWQRSLLYFCLRLLWNQPVRLCYNMYVQIYQIHVSMYNLYIEISRVWFFEISYTQIIGSYKMG